MSTEQMQNTLDEILNLYKELEKQYNVDLTDYYVHVKRVKNDISEVIWLAERYKNL